jgi:hypothetical protein
MIPLALLLLAVTVNKTAAVVWDPMNKGLTPKAIPGAKVDYTITVNNGTLGALDQDKTIITDAVPVKTKLCVDDIGILGSGPVVFVSVLSNLTYGFTSLSSATDDVEFSNNSGASYVYTPVADSDGCDAAVSHIRFKPKGKLAVAGTASFRFRVMVK